MSRVINLSMAEADVREQCRKSAIGVSSLEVLQSGGVRLVTSSVDGAEKIRKKLKSKIICCKQKNSRLMMLNYCQNWRMEASDGR